MKKNKNNKNNEAWVYKKYNENIDYVINSYKQYVIERYPNETLSKFDYIVQVTDMFVIGLMETYPFVIPLLQEWQIAGGHKISINRILNGIGQLGILFGASTYRLAEQLEIELPDNGIKNSTQFSISLPNGELLPDIKVAQMYILYFCCHEASINKEIDYLSNILVAKYTKDNNQNNLAALNVFLTLHNPSVHTKLVICTCLNIMIFSSIKDAVEFLKRMIKDAHDNYIAGNENSEIYEEVADWLIVTHKLAVEVDKILKNNAA